MSSIENPDCQACGHSVIGHYAVPTEWGGNAAIICDDPLCECTNWHLEHE